MVTRNQLDAGLRRTDKENVGENSPKRESTLPFASGTGKSAARAMISFRDQVVALLRERNDSNCIGLDLDL